MPPASPPLRRRGRALEEAVIEATLAELEESGPAGVTIGAIAARAGVHPTSIYRRFENRGQLFEAVMLRRTDQTIPVPDTGSFEGDLRALARSVRDIYRSPLGTAVLQTSSISIAAGLPARERKAFWTARADRLTVIVERAVARGEAMPGTDPILVLEMTIAPLHSRLVVTGLPVDDDLPDRVAAAVARAFAPTASPTASGAAPS